MPRTSASASDRRRAPRVPVDLRADLNVPGIGVFPGGLADLSMTGALFRTQARAPLQTGRHGVLSFTAQREPLVAVVALVRLAEARRESAAEFGIGLEFVSPSDSARAAIGRLTAGQA